MWDLEGDPSIVRLSLVCGRRRQLAPDEGFRKVVHFKWLNTVHDWATESEDFKKKYHVMCEIIYAAWDVTDSTKIPQGSLNSEGNEGL